MLKVTHKEEIICDFCCKPIPQLIDGGLFGTRFTMRNRIFGPPKHADICFDCQQRIIRAANNKEGAGK